MVEADRHLKPLCPSIVDIFLDIYIVFECIDMLSKGIFEHIDMLSKGMQLQPYTVVPTLLGSDFGVLGHMLSGNDAITSYLRLTATSNRFAHPYY